MAKNLDEEDIKRLVTTMIDGGKKKKKRKKMKTSKKAFWVGMFLSLCLIVFAGVMIVLDKDTMSVSIFSGAGVACIPLLFNIYEKHSTQISLEHMKQDYNPNYDEEMGLH